MSCLDLYIDLEDITQEEREASLENVSFGGFPRGERASTSRNRDEEKTPLFAQDDYREESDSDYIAPSESEEDCDVSGESDFEESDDEMLENEERDCNPLPRRHVYSKMGKWDASCVDKDEFALKMWDETPEGMDIGVCFKSQSEAKHPMKLWNIHHKREYTVAASSPRRWAVRCRTFNVESEDGEPPCEWKMRVSLKAHSLHKIVRWHDAHNCMTPVNDNDNRCVDASLIARLIRRKVEDNVDYTVASAQKDVKTLLKVDVPYKRAWHRRRKAIEVVYGDWTSNFEELSRYIAALKFTNPETVVEWEWKEGQEGWNRGNRTFKYVFWSFAPMAETKEQLSARNCMTPIPPELWKKYEKMNDKAACFEATPFDGDDDMWRVVTATRLSGRGGSLHTVNYNEHRIEMVTPASGSQYDYQPKHLHPGPIQDKMLYRQTKHRSQAVYENKIPDIKTFRFKGRRYDSDFWGIYKKTTLEVDGDPVYGTTVSRTADEWRDQCEAYLGFRPAQVNGQCVNVGIFEDEMGPALPENSTVHRFKQRARTLILHFISSSMFPNKTQNTVNLQFLAQVKDLDQCSRYSWGSALLAVRRHWNRREEYVLRDLEEGDPGSVYEGYYEWFMVNTVRLISDPGNYEPQGYETSSSCVKLYSEVLNNIRVSTERFREKREDENLLDEELDKHLDDIINQTHAALTLGANDEMEVEDTQILVDEDPSLPSQPPPGKKTKPWSRDKIGGGRKRKVTIPPRTSQQQTEGQQNEDQAHSSRGSRIQVETHFEDAGGTETQFDLGRFETQFDLGGPETQFGGQSQPQPGVKFLTMGESQSQPQLEAQFGGQSQPQ
ncbi:OLC1v1029393C1 [Oldenlandia corymbosa var. corymbosa]|uniref:OLC1v1029393C1 n=1 Tax=Oldenlandia corymbosa var. corymbosa TaxID=529605 RepID=A0AAV1CF93_OLDCO|nr:OLC1v1029393C1 [Oldenlandia corymbosa var. corymbosa]